MESRVGLRVHDVESAFVRKLGAQRDESGDHIYFYLRYQGADYTVAKLSHSWRGDLNPTQIDMVRRKLHLQTSEFERFVGCSQSADRGIAIWQDRHS